MILVFRYCWSVGWQSDDGERVQWFSLFRRLPAFPEITGPVCRGATLYRRGTLSGGISSIPCKAAMAMVNSSR